LSDSFVKGIKGGVNWADALQAAITDATVTPPDWSVEGRGGIAKRNKLGYVPQDDDTPGGIPGRSASRTLEYAFNDFSIVRHNQLRNHFL
jgi:putative alpha-1,2-mannosidase